MAKLSKTKAETADSAPPESTVQPKAADSSPPIDTEDAEHTEALMEAAAIAAQPVAAAVPLVSSQDIAMAKAQYDSSPLTTALLTELRREGGGKRNWPAPFTDSGPLPRPGPETVAAIVFDSGQALCGPDDLGQLQDLQARFDATFKTAEQYSVQRTSDHLFAAKQEMQDMLHNGQDVSNITLPTRETVFHNLLARSQALQSLLLQMTQEETVPICRPIMEAAEQLIEAWLRSQEEQDKSMATGFHLPFIPSYLWRAGAVIACRYTVAGKLPPAHLVATPRQVLEGLVQL